MSEWWTYRLSDFLMFSAGTWYRLLELHNARWWPLHGVWLAGGLLVLLAVGRPAPRLTKWALVVTGAACLFTAWAFLWRSYADINWAASYAAAAFAAQGAGLLGLAVRSELRVTSGEVARAGQALVLAALVYPALALLLGRPWVQSEWFALMPDPTALAALGLLLCLKCKDRALAWGWFCVPLLWCAFSGATLLSLNAPEWWMLPALGLLALGMRWRAGQR